MNLKERTIISRDLDLTLDDLKNFEEKIWGSNFDL